MEKSGQIQLFRTSAWMHVGRAMQEQRSGVPSRPSILGQAPKCYLRHVLITLSNAVVLLRLKSLIKVGNSI